jgi:hypothetical protein
MPRGERSRVSRSRFGGFTNRFDVLYSDRLANGERRLHASFQLKE